MSNNNLFRALSSSTRVKILKMLLNQEKHVSGLARELKMSVPVISRHIKILEDAGLVDKKVFGNTYVLTAKIKNLENTLETFTQEATIELEKKKSIFEALKQIPSIEIKKVGNHYYIKSIDGEEGYYIYEIDGNLPTKPIDEYTIDKNVTLDLKKIVTVKKKKIKINVEKTK